MSICWNEYSNSNILLENMNSWDVHQMNLSIPGIKFEYTKPEATSHHIIGYKLKYILENFDNFTMMVFIFLNLTTFHTKDQDGLKYRFL